MSGTKASFTDQQNKVSVKHPSQRAKDMDDTEKIYHLQQEIDSLRTQIRAQNGGSLNTATSTTTNSSSSSNSVAASSLSFPVLTVGLLLAVALVGLWRRTTGRGRSSGRSSFLYSGSTRSTGEEMTMTFELPDAHEALAAPSITLSERPAAAYMAPSAEVQFV
jgi:hypothetical protein